jgi:PAS domain S-box-containing protein
MKESASKGNHMYEELKESEQIFRTIFENAADGILLADSESKKIFMGNKQICIALGYSPDEIKGIGVMDIHPEKDLPYILCQFEKLTQNEIHVAKDIPVKRKDGSIYYADISAIPITMKDTTYLTGIFRDVSDRKQTEEAMKASEAKYRLLADNMYDIIWITDMNFNITYVTPSVEKILGFTPEERYRQSPTNVLTPESQKKAAEALFQYLEAEQSHGNDPGKTVHLELEYLHKNGSIIWMESVSRPIRDETGRIIGFHGAARDITKRKLAEKELQRHHEHLESLVQKRTRDLSTANKRLKQENDMRKRTEGSLRYRESQLKKKKQELEEINSTLKILLKQRGEDKTSMEKNIVSNIKISVLPFLEKLEDSGLEKDQLLILEQIKAQIKEVTSPFIKKISSELLGLTNSEIQVAYLIKERKSSQEIAGIMNVSLNTIITHRYNIRRKTGLKNNKVNLCTYLQTLE